MIFDIIQNIIMFIPVMTLIIVLLLYGSDIYKNGVKPICVQLKALVCMLLSFAIVISSMIIMVVNIYWLAVALEEVEDISYFAKESMFTCILFIWSIIGAVLIFNIWRHIYYHNYDLIDRVKIDWKKIKERKHYGRYKNPN